MQTGIKNTGPDLRTNLLEILDQFPRRKIVVVGDFIADEFLHGRISRISREAPVLVLEYRDLIRLPGGAGNAANNLLDLGCKVAIAGTVGQDDAGKHITATLRSKGADMRALRRLRAYATPIKTRILAGAHHSALQQLVRVDRIHDAAASPQPSWNLLQHSLRRADGIIVSDYGLGTISPSLLSGLRRTAEKRNIPIIVDSRFRMLEFRDVTAITPNITELEAAIGIPIGNDAGILKRIGRRVLRSQNLRSLLVTQGRFGMTLFEPDKAPLHIPVHGTDEVADVTGAGDTVIALYTLALACGALPEHAARLANFAGGIVVMKRGTATVTCRELRDAIQSS